MIEVASEDHIDASVGALEALADALSTSGSNSGDALHISFCHFQHDAFLSPQLQALIALDTDGQTVELQDSTNDLGLSVDELCNMVAEWAAPAEVKNLLTRRALQLRDPGQSTDDFPNKLMISLNVSVETQVTAALSSVATFLGRRQIVRQGIEPGHLPLLPQRAKSTDERATIAVADISRAHGWRQVASQLRERSISQNTPLRVTYRQPAFKAREVALRAPIHRHAYNLLPDVRAAVDKVVARMSRGFHVAGDVSDAMLRQAEDLMEETSWRGYIAHVMRDAFVCGNGVLQLAQHSIGEMVLVSPEAVVDVADHRIRVQIDGTDSWIDRALHVPGARQIGSDLGVSHLEPILQIAHERSLWLDTLLTARAWRASPRTPQTPDIQRFIAQSEPLAVTELGKTASNLESVLGMLTTAFDDPPVDLYFSGHELMAPACDRTVLNGQQPNAKT